MEYTQWDILEIKKEINSYVLILVVMEYTQWAAEFGLSLRFHFVLILVVMEYTQWAIDILQEDVVSGS